MMPQELYSTEALRTTSLGPRGRGLSLIPRLDMALGVTWGSHSASLNLHVLSSKVEV